VTVTDEFDLDTVKMNHCAKYLGQRSFHAKASDPTHTHTHSGSTALPVP